MTLVCQEFLQNRYTGLGLLITGFAALSLFLYGFFPLKYHSGKLSHLDDLPNFIDGVSIDGQQVYNSGENSVVLMVIDGLRYDFVTEEYMPYAGQLLKNKSACIYVSVAEPPTVTMPRIKSPERKKEQAQWRRTINFWRDIFASVTISILHMLELVVWWGLCLTLTVLELGKLNCTTTFECKSSESVHMVNVDPLKQIAFRKLGDNHSYLAMMTGSVSTFADVALNFGAPAVRGDSVLRVANARGRKTVLYGDDTWLRLFPGLWTEYDGTTSFYVTDYTEVDNNVTRHLDTILTPDENKKPTFDFLVLHYLGLDHIGHLEGARSPKIKPKLIEMDEVVKRIFTAMQQWDRNGILIVCGDHGMRDAGGHGGSSPSEVLVPLLLVKSQDFTCPHPLGPGPTVAQVDLAPSISWLLGAPPPGDSTGRILPALLPRDPRQHLYLLHVIAEHNTKQVVSKDVEFFRQFKRAEKQFAHYLATSQQSAAKISREFYEESLEKMAEYLAETTVNFDYFAIVTAIILLYLIATSLLCVTLYSFQPESQRVEFKRRFPSRSSCGGIVAIIVILTVSNLSLVTACFISETKSALCSFSPEWLLVLAIIPYIMTATYFIIQNGIEKIKDLSTLNYLNAIDYLLIGGTIFHSISFFGTSFIEEEHMTWYFFWNTLMFFVLVRTLVVVIMYVKKKWSGATEVQEKPELAQRMAAVGVGIVPKWVLLIALHRYLRTMNQSGYRWISLPDTADWLKEPENAFYLQAHLFIGTVGTLIICIYNLRYMNNVLNIHTILTVAATACILCYRIASQALASPFKDIKTWDTVNIVNVFWAILTFQFIFEILSYIGVFKSCGCEPLEHKTPASNQFIYNKPKEKVEDRIYDDSIHEPWNVDEVKLNLVRSASHLMLNDMMLIIVLLMRPHNVIMVPSIYITCKVTSQCMDHKLLDSRSVKRTEVVDTLSRTLVHMWIGILFFFYQGNSNSLAAVDLGSGYVGLREYSAWRVAARMGLHAYAGPALAGAALYCTLAAHARSWQQYLQEAWRATNILALHRVYAVFVYCIIATIFRNHLFIWSVFSPKLLYDFVATVFSVQALATIAQIEGLAHFTNWLARICKGLHSKFSKNNISAI